MSLESKVDSCSNLLSSVGSSATIDNINNAKNPTHGDTESVEEQLAHDHYSNVFTAAVSRNTLATAQLDLNAPQLLSSLLAETVDGM